LIEKKNGDKISGTNEFGLPHLCPSSRGKSRGQYVRPPLRSQESNSSNMDLFILNDLMTQRDPLEKTLELSHTAQILNPMNETTASILILHEKEYQKRSTSRNTHGNTISTLDSTRRAQTSRSQLRSSARNDVFSIPKTPMLISEDGSEIKIKKPVPPSVELYMKVYSRNGNRVSKTTSKIQTKSATAESTNIDSTDLLAIGNVI